MRESGVYEPTERSEIAKIVPEQRTGFRESLGEIGLNVRTWVEEHPYVTIPVGVALVSGLVSALAYLTYRL